MPRTCTICSHPKRAAIEAALVAGTPYRDIALQHRVGVLSVQRHASDHVKQQIAQAQEARDEAQALDVVRQLKAINGASIAILAAARRTGKHETALRAIDRIQRQLELQAKLLGDLDERPVVNVMLSPEWLHVRAAMLAALAPHPEARLDVAAALFALEAAGNGGGGNHGHGA
jgi:hypothetical protein